MSPTPTPDVMESVGSGEEELVLIFIISIHFNIFAFIIIL